MRVDGTNLSMVRGDSESITLTIKENDANKRYYEALNKTNSKYWNNSQTIVPIANTTN